MSWLLLILQWWKLTYVINILNISVYFPILSKTRIPMWIFNRYTWSICNLVLQCFVWFWLSNRTKAEFRPIVIALASLVFVACHWAWPGVVCLNTLVGLRILDVRNNVGWFLRTFFKSLMINIATFEVSVCSLFVNLGWRIWIGLGIPALVKSRRSLDRNL